LTRIVGNESRPGEVSPDRKEKAASNLRYARDRGSDSALSFLPKKHFLAFMRPFAAVVSALFLGASAFAVNSNTSIFSRDATPANDSYNLQLFVYAITTGIFLVVGSLGAYAVIKFRARPGDEKSEPVQIFGSNQIELSWTIIPILIVVVLFLTTARMIFAVQDAPEPPNSIKVTAIGHQYWWEFQYPQYGFTTANELHVPVSDPKSPTPTYIKLSSADVIHSFWVPRLAGKTDLIPARVNEMWIDPSKPGMYEGQCSQFCGTEHAKMLLRVYVQPRADFDTWVKNQQLAAVSTEAQGRHVFESQACVNCHAVKGTIANGRFGPDLTHLMSRDTIASGAADNSPDNLRRWIENPDVFKSGSNMPAMNLSPEQLTQVTAYLTTLR
jgi:cytochrome c oxidase subunit 2